MPSLKLYWEAVADRMEQLEAELIKAQAESSSNKWNVFQVEETEVYPEEILHCVYCKNEFIPDSRGACNSCGAPRSVQ